MLKILNFHKPNKAQSAKTSEVKPHLKESEFIPLNIGGLSREDLFQRSEKIGFEEYELPETPPSFFAKLRDAMPEVEMEMPIPDYDEALGMSYHIYSQAQSAKIEAEGMIFRAVGNNYEDFVQKDGTRVSFKQKNFSQMDMIQKDKKGNEKRITSFNRHNGKVSKIVIPKQMTIKFENDDENKTSVFVYSKSNILKHYSEEKFVYSFDMPKSYVFYVRKQNGESLARVAYDFIEED